MLAVVARRDTDERDRVETLAAVAAGLRPLAIY